MSMPYTLPTQEVDMATKEEYQRNKANGNAARYRETAKAKRKALIARIAAGEATPEEVAEREAFLQKSRLYGKQWYNANKEAKDKKNKEWQEQHPEVQRSNHKRWYAKNKDKRLEQSRRYNAEHPEERKIWASTRSTRMRETTPEKYILSRLLARKRKGRCTLTIEDIVLPDVCPLLGMPFQFGTGSALPNSPSVDCIDPTKGYIKGNIWIISKQANSMKSCASKDELRTFCTNVLRSIEDGVLAAMPETKKE